MVVNPEDFIITRKRKLYKFALFANSPLCFEFDEWSSARFQPDHIELGAGTGLFCIELARRDPLKQFVAVDIKADRLQVGAKVAIELGVSNIRFLRARADQLVEIFKPNLLDSVWLTFPDPFPKPRSAARRMTHPRYLQMYASLLKSSGSFFLKHDNRDFFCWSLEQLVSESWRITELSFDLHDTTLSDEYKTMTTYEKKWLSEGLTTNFVHARLYR